MRQLSLYGRKGARAGRPGRPSRLRLVAVSERGHDFATLPVPTSSAYEMGLILGAILMDHSPELKSLKKRFPLWG